MKVFYQRTYSIAPYLTERIGFEMETEHFPFMDSQIAIDQVKHLKELCDKAHKELNPNLEEMKGTHVVPVQSEPSKINQKELDAAIEREFNELKERIVATTSKAAAGQLLMDSSFKHNMELKQLVNNKTD